LPEYEQAKANRELLVAIRTSFNESGEAYGSPRVCGDMRARGHQTGEHRVARLMRKFKLVARPKRRRWPKDAECGPSHALAPNTLEGRFEALAPNMRWTADFAYLWTREGWLYVAVVIDLYSRYAVGWSMSASMTSQLVCDALMMAFWQRGKPKGLLHHSDQGS
jgi:putative transposase